MQSPIRVVLADDHPIFRDGFTLLLQQQEDIQLVGEADNGMELLRVIEEKNPDVVITDIKMPMMNGIQASRQIIKKYPSIGIIALSVFDDDDLVVEMLESGARGYLLKNTSREELLEAVRVVHEGGVHYCHATKMKTAHLIARSRFNPYRKESAPKFSTREIEIIQLICKQLSNKEIADSLNLSVRTIESHREKIFEKMDVRNMVGLAIYAIRNNLFEV